MKKFTLLGTSPESNELNKKPSLGQNLIQNTRMWAREKLNESMLKQPELTYYVEALVNNNPQIREIVSVLNSPLPDVRKQAKKAILRMYEGFIHTISSSPTKKTPLYKRMTPKIFLLATLTACGQPAPTLDPMLSFNTGRLVGGAEERIKHLEEKNKQLEDELKKLADATKQGMQSLADTASLKVQSEIQRMIDERRLTVPQVQQAQSQIKQLVEGNTSVENVMSSLGNMGVDPEMLEASAFPTPYPTQDPADKHMPQFSPSPLPTLQPTPKPTAVPTPTPTPIPTATPEVQETMKPLFHELQLLPLQADAFIDQDVGKLAVVNMNKTPITLNRVTFLTDFQSEMDGPATIVVGDKAYSAYLTDGMFGLPNPITIPGETNMHIVIRFKFKEGANIPVDNTYKGRVLTTTEVETIDSNGNVHITTE